MTDTDTDTATRPSVAAALDRAVQDLDAAADGISASDWVLLPAARRLAVRRALVLIDEAKDAVSEAAAMDTIDLDEEDR